MRPPPWTPVRAGLTGAAKRARLLNMTFEVLTRGRNLVIGAARLLDFQGSMHDGCYGNLYRLFRGGRPTDALKNDVRELGADFRRVIEREQESR